MVQLAERIASSSETSCVELIVMAVGDGTEIAQFENFLEGREGNLKTTTFYNLAHKDVIKIMSESDFFISLYRFSNLGNPLLEAAALRLPFITIGGPGVSQIFLDESPYGRFLEEGQEDRILQEGETVFRSLMSEQASSAAVVSSKSAYRHPPSWEARVAEEISLLHRARS